MGRVSGSYLREIAENLREIEPSATQLRFSHVQTPALRNTGGALTLPLSPRLRSLPRLAGHSRPALFKGLNERGTHSPAEVLGELRVDIPFEMSGYKPLK